MKILFVEAVQNYGGARKSTVELAYRLKKSNNEVLIVDFWGSCQPFLDAMMTHNIDYELLDPRDKPFLLSSQSLIKRVKNYINYFILWLSYRKKINRIIKEKKPDLIIVNNTKTLSILPSNSNSQIGYFARGWFLPRTISFFNKYLIKKKANIFIGVSHATRAAIYAGGFTSLENIYVVQNAIDLHTIDNIKSHSTFESWHDAIDRPIELFHCGGFLPSKGQDVMIGIAKELKKRNINFKIKLAGIVYKGDKSERFLANLKNEINKESLSEYFTFIINETNVIKEFSTIDLLIHPSATEGLPRVAMEAMAFGKPVIGNPVGGMSDYILNGFTGNITNHNSINDYCDCIEEFYHNKSVYKEVSMNAEHLIRSRFTEENQLTQFTNLIKNIKKC